MKPRDDFRITSVRLVEFHNLGTTTVPIPEGGHLFLLGDNGSGKTTLLDAVHLVLTAGREMELNSAARVAGAKDSGGRTMQGIVLRYNAATGRTFRETGITYAAVELRAPSGKLVSLIVGLSAEGMDVAFERWGGIASVPVDELPLTIEDNGRMRAATQAEFKKGIAQLVGGRYFAHAVDYREAVANRVFGGPVKYADVCRLLRTGKAYREIAARASNYDDLFRQLLEDPSRDTFEPLLKGLRELDESEAKFSELDARADYLSSLQTESAKLSRLRLELQLIDWFEAVAELRRAESDLAAWSDAIAAGETEAKELERLAAEAVDEANHARERFNSLRAKDATGLLDREKEVAVRCAEAERRATEAAAQLAAEKKSFNSADRVLRTLRTDRLEQLMRAADDIQKSAKGTSVAVGTLVGALRGARSESEVAQFSAFESNFGNLRKALGETRETDVLACERSRQQVRENAVVVEERRAKLAEIRGRGENLPELEGFAEVRRDVRAAILKARPVYELLEPASGCDARHLAWLERLAGDDFWATWLVEDGEVDSLRRILYKNDGTFTLAVRGEVGSDDRVTAWLGRYVDYDESDVEAVKLLASHLAAAGAPTESEFLDKATWTFRGREGLLNSGRPRLVGLKAREAEQARREREAETALATAERELRAAEKKAAADEAALAAVKALEGVVERAREIAVETSGKANAALVEQRRLEERCRLMSEGSAEKRQQFEVVRVELEDIRVRMRSEGIDDTLERRIKAAEKAIAAAEAKKGDLDRRIGGVRGRIEGLVAQRDRRSEERANFAESIDSLEAKLGGMAEPGKSFGEMAQTLCPAAAVPGVDFTKLREKLAGDSRVAENNIDHRIRDPRGEAYAFVFDRAENRLSDRRGVGLDQVLGDERRRLEELRGAINRRSREVFERIFMGEVMQRLYVDLIRLEDLVGRVQRQLSGRRFGSNRYAFSLQPVPEYEGFVRLVRRGYMMDAGGEKDELKEYLELRKDEILHADIDSIPDIFDYRRWFRFVLKVVVENDEGLVIDRKVKSMGSGGEQAVPNYLLILTVAEFLYHGGTDTERPKCAPLLFDEAFYGIDAARRDQLLAFADDLGLQLFVSSPDQDGVKREIRNSVSLIVVKDENLDVHLSPVLWKNSASQASLFDEPGEPSMGMTLLEETK